MSRTPTTIGPGDPNQISSPSRGTFVGFASGGSGNDHIIGGNGDETVFGGTGHDQGYRHAHMTDRWVDMHR